MTAEYDSSWDGDDDEDTFDRKYEEWRSRDWMAWLSAKLVFPFDVKREEDMEKNPFDPNTGPFSVGQRMQAIALDEGYESGSGTENQWRVCNCAPDGMVFLHAA